MEVPDELPTIVGYSVLLAITICMMLVIYNDHIFKERPWVLYLLSGIIAFSIEVMIRRLRGWRWTNDLRAAKKLIGKAQNVRKDFPDNFSIGPKKGVGRRRCRASEPLRCVAQWKFLCVKIFLSLSLTV